MDSCVTEHKDACFYLSDSLLSPSPTPTYYSLNTITKVICLKSNVDHITALLKTTSWLSFEVRAKTKALYQDLQIPHELALHLIF